MSEITRAFQETRIEHGLKQHPNWSGTVYGACMTKGCGNYKKIGYYEGGFCKVCSTRYPDDKPLPVLTSIELGGFTVSIPNPEIRWTVKRWVTDLSDKLSPEEQRQFYMTPEERARRGDRIDYSEPEEEDAEEQPGHGAVRGAEEVPVDE